ncbi:acyl-CoA-binding domain-containing protein 5-B-like isoform X1 [Clarias magur]|uniref:Acyl-CoA-binding domain-containing protein 5-B-like isoform X1 n=1 Tax=Clarias magur TaxID=1594786 RepID=A0A8J4T6W1_CLAMG|nr:acyl-CoA-binding domain-containing protein 5-B-like isoform X1 [Clarias magur]
MSDLCKMENYSSRYQRRFEAAVKVMKTLPEDGALVPSDDMLIALYAHYRQATVGVSDSTEPRGRDALSKAKWEAWKALGDMSKEAAMKAYVEEILLILEMIPVTEEVCDLLDVLEPFYEVVEDEDKETTNKPAMSTFSDTDMTRLTVASGAERGGSLVCNGRNSSLVKSTHGSLNTEEDEEETEHSRGTSQGSPGLQHLSDDGGDVSDLRRLSEVYSDSVRAEEGSVDRRAAEARAKTPEGRGGGTTREGVSQDGRPHGAAQPPLCTAAHGPLQSVIESAGRAGGCKFTGETMLNDGTLGSVAATDSVNTQIAAALSRLQDDMRSVLAKVNALETRAESRVKSLALHREPRTARANKEDEAKNRSTMQNVEAAKNIDDLLS